MGLTFYHVIILYIYASAINIPTKRMTDLELHIEKMTYHERTTDSDPKPQK